MFILNYMFYMLIKKGIQILDPSNSLITLVVFTNTYIVVKMTPRSLKRFDMIWALLCIMLTQWSTPVIIFAPVMRFVCKN